MPQPPHPRPDTPPGPPAPRPHINRKAEQMYNLPGMTPGIKAAERVLEFVEITERKRLPRPTGVAAGQPVSAYFSHGRWVVICDLIDPKKLATCNSAQVVSDSDKRFFCVQCLNAGAGGKWRRVNWPADPDAVEAFHVDRLPQDQNWRPGEELVDPVGPVPDPPESPRLPHPNRYPLPADTWGPR